MLNNSTASDLRGALKLTDIEVKKTRICGRQITRDNVQAGGSEDYSRKAITTFSRLYAK
jgi:hypothetical protein